MKKILIFDRMNSSNFPGGDTVQIHAIKNFLDKNGYQVKLSNQPKEDISEYDYVFIFNLTNPYEAYIQMKACQKNGVPYILFPVYWNLDSLNIAIYINKKAIIKRILPKLIKSMIRAKNFIKKNNEVIEYFGISNLELLNSEQCIKEILKNAYYICPNSHAEWQHLNENFSLDLLNNNVKVIYNGIDISLLSNIKLDENSLTKYDLPEKYICCVGGIGPRKNQLNLVKAANHAKINLVIIGKSAYGYEDYYNAVRSAAGTNIFFLEHLPQQEVFKILKNSIGHIQPSFIETPGLATLEAATLGVPIIVANTAPVKEYFGDSATYCDPNDLLSISKSLSEGFYGSLQKKEISSIKHLYNWDDCLKELLDII